MIEYTKKWRFAKEAYAGTGGFSDGEYIERYTRENDDKFHRRKKSAYYANLFAQKVQRYIGYLYRKPPVRTAASDLIRLIFDDADMRGNSADVFFSSFASEAKVRGAGLLLVDMPKELPNSLAAQKEARAVPFFRFIEPERVTAYKLDRLGRLEYVRFTDTIDNSTPNRQESILIERHYDTKGWKVLDGDTVIEQGEHRLGECPVLTFGERGKFPDIGEFTQVADLAKRHYNLKSELDEILRSQTFSILTFNGNPADTEIKLSTENAIFYPKDHDRPEFVSPESGPAKIYQDEIAATESMISRVCYDIDTTQRSESGVALEIKFQGLNGSLANFAMRMEDLESRAFALAARYLDMENDVIVSYPREFHILDVPKEIATLEAVKSLGYTLPTYEAAKLKRIVQNDLGGVDDETMEKIGAEIEDALKQL